MIQIPKKLLLADQDGRQYIRYDHKKFLLFVEILKFDNPREASSYWDKLAGWHQVSEKVMLATPVSFDNKKFILVASEIFFKTEATDKLYTNMQHRVNRLASWYFYTYLLPESKEEIPPILPPKF